MTRKDRTQATRSAFAEIGMLIETILVWKGTHPVSGTPLLTQRRKPSALDLIVYETIANANMPLFTDDQGQPESPVA
jgi:hypothetical protein